MNFQSARRLNEAMASLSEDNVADGNSDKLFGEMRMVQYISILNSITQLIPSIFYV